MRFQFTYRTTASELWQLSMYYTYGSMVGICNLIFTAGVLALIVSRWEMGGMIWKALLMLGLCLFPVIQPAAVYLRAKKQAAAITKDTTVSFSDSGIHVTVGDKNSDIGWNKIRKVSKKPTMIILFSDTTHGFILSNHVLKQEKDDFYEYIISKTRHA